MGNVLQWLLSRESGRDVLKTLSKKRSELWLRGSCIRIYKLGSDERGNDGGRCPFFCINVAKYSFSQACVRLVFQFIIRYNFARGVVIRDDRLSFCFFENGVRIKK